MLSPREGLDLQFQASPGLALRQGPGRGAGRAARPPCAGLPARAAVGRAMVDIHLIGRSPTERRVRRVLIVPINHQADLAAKRAGTVVNAFLSRRAYGIFAPGSLRTATGPERFAAIGRGRHGRAVCRAVRRAQGTPVRNTPREARWRATRLSSRQRLGHVGPWPAPVVRAARGPRSQTGPARAEAWNARATSVTLWLLRVASSLRHHGFVQTV